MQKRMICLKNKLQVATNQRGVLLDDADHNDFKELLISESGKISKQYVTGPAKTGHICTNYIYSENVTFLGLCL